MNKVTLLGRLTRDPEVKYTTNTNTLVASFGLAVNRRFAKPGEERQADFFNITAWAKTGEFCSKYFKKGQQVLLVGRLETRSWEDENKQKRNATDIVAEEVYFADSKRDAGDSGFENTFGTTATTNSEFTVSSEDDLPF